MSKNKKVFGFYFFASYMSVFDLLRSSVKKWKLMEAIYLYSVCGKSVEFESDDLKKCFKVIKSSIDSNKKSGRFVLGGNEKKKILKDFEETVASCVEDSKEDFDQCVGGLKKHRNVGTPENKRGFTRIEQELNQNKTKMVLRNDDSINNILIKSNNNLNFNLKEKEILKKKKEDFFLSGCVCVKNKTPTLDDVKNYIFEKGLFVNPEEFYNYYESNGWMSAGQPIINWKAKCNGWHIKKLSDDSSSFVRSDISSRVYNKKDLNDAVSDSWEEFMKHPFE